MGLGNIIENQWVTGIRKKDILPNKLSGLLFLAIKDIEKIKKNKDYELNMGYWNNPYYSPRIDKKVCYVCMAGAVMANTLKAPKDKATRPLSYNNEKIENKLQAIENLRCFSLEYAIKSLLGHQYKKFEKISIKHNIPALEEKIKVMIDNYRCKKSIWYKHEIVDNAQNHISLYKKYAKLLKKEGF